jgi:isoaspartyl peptidase/L-asparaginase-like protein (Ntn-hydrolase superfamily)
MKVSFEPVIISNWEHGRRSVEIGVEVLRKSGSALDAVEQGICAVEDDPEVDSVGTGGIPNIEGVGELDASIMVGNTYRSGAVSCLTRTKNPISVARKVMELSPHNMLCGEGARRFARAVGFPDYEPVTRAAKEKWFSLRQKLFQAMQEPSMTQDYHRALGYDTDLGSLIRGIELLVHAGEIKQFGTVGTLAVDRSGTIVAGTSTSGWALRLPGRVSDSSVIGAGNYACPSGASSSTGLGEYAIKHNLTRKVCDRLEEGYSPTEACEETLRQMLKRERVPVILALIAVDKQGRVGGATTKEPFCYQYQRVSDKAVTKVVPTPISV